MIVVDLSQLNCATLKEEEAIKNCEGTGFFNSVCFKGLLSWCFHQKASRVLAETSGALDRPRIYKSL